MLIGDRETDIDALLYVIEVYLHVCSDRVSRCGCMNRQTWG